MPPVRRRAARVAVVDPQGRVLLFRGHDPARPQTPIWHAPGGGVEPGEDDRTAARRELVEETGLVADLGPLIWVRHVEFGFDGVQYAQDEVYFLVEVPQPFEPDTSQHQGREAEYLTGHGWFSAEDLRALADLVAPPDLADRLEELVAAGPSLRPVEVGGAVLP